MPKNKQFSIPHSRPYINEADIRAVTAALRAGELAEGRWVDCLERSLSAMYGGETIAVSSGTAALALALVALGLKKNDAVAIPSYACRSLYAAVAYAGAQPFCVDAGPHSLCPVPLKSRRYPFKAAVIPHLFGFEADFAGWWRLGVPIIEDCAQALGGYSGGGKRLGCKGDVAVFSFYATKLAAGGEGGACLVHNPELAARIRALRHCDETPLHPKAFNFKMSDLHAALAWTQLKKLPFYLKRREAIAKVYDKAFAKFSWRKRHHRRQAVCFRYLLELPPKQLDWFLDESGKRGIACRRPVPEPLHRGLGGHCPYAENWQTRLVSVPIYPSLTAAEISYIIETLTKLLKQIL